MDEEKKKLITYVAIGGAVLVVIYLVMKRGSTASTSTDNSTGQPVVVAGSDGSGSSGTATLDPATQQALQNIGTNETALAAGLTAIQNTEQQSQQSMIAIATLIQNMKTANTTPTVVTPPQSIYNPNTAPTPIAPIAPAPISYGNNFINTVVGVASNASVIALGGNAVQSNSTSSTYITNNPNQGQVNVTTVNNSAFANAQPESAMTGGSYSIVKYNGTTYNVDNATGKAYTG